LCYIDAHGRAVATVTGTGEGTPAPERLHALDAVRGGALLLGIVYHATLSFIPSTVKIWIVMDTQSQHDARGVVLHEPRFRMTTFFLIAGFFAHTSFHRRGAVGFIKDRLIRLAVPLVVARGR
jgi:glucan biosynthesis protein C